MATMNDIEDLRILEAGGEEMCRGKGVKVEAGDPASYVDPYYAEQPLIVFDRINPVSRKVFAEKYGLCNEGISPKRLKIGLHLSEDDVELYFGPCINRNGYKYSYTENEEFIKEVELRWMICHQRTGVPNSRIINKSEAHAWAFEKVKAKKVNWTVFAEWTCRDQLSRVQRISEKDNVGSGSLLEAKKEGAQERRRSLPGDPKPGPSFTTGDVTEIMPESSNRRLSDFRENKSVGEWQEYLATLERELPCSEDVVIALFKKKEAAILEKVRVVSEVDYGSRLLISAEEKLQQLRSQLDEKTKSKTGFEGDDSSNLEISNLMKQIDSQVGVVATFRQVSGPGNADQHSILLKCKQAEETWINALEKLEVWRMHKVELQQQLKNMKLGLQRPGLFPTPMPFVVLDPKECKVQPFEVSISECPFCRRGFEPAWDCKLASCKHGYHSWCAYTHFSKSTRCFLKTCNQEMHSDWWIMAGVVNPTSLGVEASMWNAKEAIGGVSGAEDFGRASVSYSTQTGRLSIQRRSRTVSPSVGSIKLANTRMQSTLPVTELEATVLALPEEEPMMETPATASRPLPSNEVVSGDKRRRGVKKNTIQATMELVAEPSSKEQHCFEEDEDQATANSGRSKSEDGGHEEGDDEAENVSAAKRRRSGGKEKKTPIEKRVSQARITRATQNRGK